MKNHITKRIIALILALVTLGSLSAVSFSADNLEENTETSVYHLFFNTAGSAGISRDRVSVKLFGDKGESEWTDVGYVGGKGMLSTTCKYSGIECKNVGDVDTIKVRVEGSDEMYLNYMEIAYDHGNKRFHAGRWVDNEGITLRQTDTVYRMEIHTDACKNAGTDQDVFVTLYDRYGKQLASENLSDIHFKSNAFEQNDTMDFYLYAPCGKSPLPVVELRLDNAWTYAIASGWKIDTVFVECVSGVASGISREIEYNHWMEMGDTYSIVF